MIYSIGIEINGTHRFIRIYSQLNKPHYSTIGRKLGATSLWTSNRKILYSVGKMIEDYIDLSPDIEWMLQSNQVDSETIIEILVRDYYKPIFCLILPGFPTLKRLIAQLKKHSSLPPQVMVSIQAKGMYMIG